jgi:hypothetical protein
MVCREFERADIGTLQRMLGLARLVQAYKYLNQYPMAGIPTDVLSKFGRISSKTKSPHRDAVPVPKGR